MYSDLLRQKPIELENILLLVEIMLTLTVGPSTAACERGFSVLNRIKTNLRCSLGQDCLRQLLNISVHEFNSQKEHMAVIKRAVNKWLCSGHKHVDGHKLYDSSTKSSSSASKSGAEPDEPDQLTPGQGPSQSVSAEAHIQEPEDDDFVIMENLVQVQVASEK